MNATPRTLAPISLVIAAALFAATLPFTHLFAFGLLHAFAEASMIGGLADWFAVVALFRHPLGIPVPHTGILPKHRAKLTSGIVDVMENNWLNKASILARIGEWRIVPSILDYFALSANRKPVLGVAKSMFVSLLREDDSEAIAARLGTVLHHELTEERMAHILQRSGEYAAASGLVHQLLPPVFERGKQWCSTEEAQSLVNDLVRQAVRKYANAPVKQLGVSLLEAIRVLDYSKMTDAILTSVGKELELARTDEEHPLRASIIQSLHGYIESAHENAELLSGLSRIRQSLAPEQDVPAWLNDMVRDGIRALRSDFEKDDAVLIQYLDRILDMAVEKLRSNPAAVNAADSWVKVKIGEIVESYHSEIGRLVRDNLDRLDDEAMVRQIESKVGGDLQYIRLNGAIVGGIVGALIYTGKYLLGAL